MIAEITPSAVSYYENPARSFWKIAPTVLSAGTMLFSLGLNSNERINVTQESYQGITYSVDGVVLFPNGTESFTPVSSLHGNSHVTISEGIEYNETRNLRWTEMSMGAIDLLDENPSAFETSNTVKTRVILGGALNLTPIEFSEDTWAKSLNDNAFESGKQIKSKVSVGREFPFTPIDWD